MAYGTLDNQCHADAYGQPFRRNDNATTFGVISDSQSLFCLWRRKQFLEIWLCITMFIQSVQTSGKKEGRFTEMKLRVQWQKYICARLTDAVLLHQKASNNRSTWLYHVITGHPESQPLNKTREIKPVKNIWKQYHNRSLQYVKWSTWAVWTWSHLNSDCSCRPFHIL